MLPTWRVFAFILNISKDSFCRIGQDVIRLIPSDDGELLPYLNCEDVAIVTILGDIYSDKYRGLNHSNKKILART